MKNLLWLDDLRNPFIDTEGKVSGGNNNWNINWVRDYKEFISWIEMYGLPDAISFDHDLAPEHYTPEYFWDDYKESEKFQDWKSKTYEFNTGEECAKWLVGYCEWNTKDKPEIFIHSANPVGADKIRRVFKQQTHTNK